MRWDGPERKIGLSVNPWELAKMVSAWIFSEIIMLGCVVGVIAILYVLFFK